MVLLESILWTDVCAVESTSYKETVLMQSLTVASKTEFILKAK